MRISAVFDGQLLFVEDYVTVDVRYGNFGGWNQIQVVYFAMIHLPFFVGQLACTIAGGSVNHRGRHYLGIAGFARFVQEEVDKCTLKLCAFAFVYGKTCTCNLNTQVEVYQVVFLGQFPVGKCVFGKFGFHAAHFLHHVVIGAYAFGYTVVRDIGDCIK